MEKTRRNWLITGIIAVAMVFSCLLGLNLNNQVQTAYALDNPIDISKVYYDDGSPYGVSFGTTMPSGYSFNNGTLTIADGATPYTIWTEGAGMLTVKFEGNYGNNTVDISNTHGDLTLTSTTPVNVTLAGLCSSERIHIEGKVNLTITGPNNAGSMDVIFSKFLVGCPNGTLYVENDASVTATDPVLHGKTISGTSFEAIFKVGMLVLNTTGCFKVGLNTTPTSTDEAYAIKVIENDPINYTSCDSGFVLYSNANEFICKGVDASDPDSIDYQTGLENKLKTIEDGNSLTIRQCQVSFDANGGSGTMDNESSYKGNYSLPNCSFTAPSGQQFKCWAVGSAGGTQYNAGANYTITDDVTFYAVWEDDAPEINYINEIRITSTTTKVEVGDLPAFTASTTTEHAVMSADNKIWTYWNNGSWYGFGGNPKVAVADGTHYAMRLKCDLDVANNYEFGDNVTIYFNGEDWTSVGHTKLQKIAAWGGYVYIDLGEAKYSVTYHSNGGNGDDFVDYAEAGDYTLLDLSATGITAYNEGNYREHFVGWSLTDNGEVIDTETINLEENKEFYAIWEANANLTGTVTVTGNLKYGETLTVNVENNNNTGNLTYRWTYWYDDGNVAEWRDIDTFNVNTYQITQSEVVGRYIAVTVYSSVENGYLEYAVEVDVVEKADAVAPTGINATACTTADNNDGSLSGITNAMEYKHSGADAWTDGTGETITGLANGTYIVRYKETATHNASEEAYIVVNEYQAPVAPKGLSAGAVVAIVLASVVVCGLGGFAVYWFVIKKKTWADFVALFKRK